ncbi:MAG: hypothetical protein FK733_15125, partial [Asgard group archaeon]|nr:hypothetical protein [Asgard group archaeon]
MIKKSQIFCLSFVLVLMVADVAHLYNISLLKKDNEIENSFLEELDIKNLDLEKNKQPTHDPHDDTDYERIYERFGNFLDLFDLIDSYDSIIP